MHEQLVALYEEVIEDLDDPVRLVELAERAAQWSLAILDDTDRAAELYRLVLDIEPEHERALDALETIARREDRPIDLEKVLTRKVDVAFDPDKRRQTLVELGQVRKRIETFEEAIAAFQEALSLDEGDTEVMNELVGLYEITERYDDLVDILDQLAQHEEDPDKRKLFYVRIGQYERQFLDRPHEAIEAYQRVLDMAQDDMSVIRSLEELYEETEQWEKLREMVERQLSDPEALGEDELLRLYVQRAKVNYEQFNDVEAAIEDYQRAFELQDDSELVVEALDELYRAEQRWDDLVDLYTHQMQIADDEERLVDLHVKMANIHHEHLGNEQRAVELLDTVLDLRPHHLGALEVQEVIYAGRNDWEQVLDVIDRKIDAVDTESEKIALLLEKASVCTNAVGDTDRAADAYLRILEIEPTHEEAIDKLEGLYRQTEAYGELYAIYEHEVAYADDQEEKVDLLLDMAELAESRLGSAELRTEALESAYELRGADLSIVEPLLDAYIESGQFEEAKPLLQSTIDELRSERQMSDVVRFEHLRGKLAERQGELETAREAYQAAHKIDATYIPNLLSLGKLEVSQQAWDDALKIFQTLLLHQMSIEDPADKVELYYNLGLVRQQLGDDRRAKDMFNRALGIDSGHEPSKEALANL
jgi:tetratricopeptide (TPR) repeat protein